MTRAGSIGSTGVGPDTIIWSACGPADLVAQRMQRRIAQQSLMSQARAQGRLPAGLVPGSRLESATAPELPAITHMEWQLLDKGSSSLPEAAEVTQWMLWPVDLRSGELGVPVALPSRTRPMPADRYDCRLVVAFADKVRENVGAYLVRDDVVLPTQQAIGRAQQPKYNNISFNPSTIHSIAFLNSSEISVTGRGAFTIGAGIAPPEFVDGAIVKLSGGGKSIVVTIDSSSAYVIPGPNWRYFKYDPFVPERTYTGTVGRNAGFATLSGVGTLFLSELVVGQRVRIGLSTYGTVFQLVADTLATLTDTSLITFAGQTMYDGVLESVTASWPTAPITAQVIGLSASSGTILDNVWTYVEQGQQSQSSVQQLHVSAPAARGSSNSLLNATGRLRGGQEVVAATAYGDRDASISAIATTVGHRLLVTGDRLLLANQAAVARGGALDLDAVRLFLNDQPGSSVTALAAAGEAVAAGAKFVLHVLNESRVVSDPSNCDRDGIPLSSTQLTYSRTASDAQPMQPGDHAHVMWLTDSRNEVSNATALRRMGLTAAEASEAIALRASGRVVQVDDLSGDEQQTDTLLIVASISTMIGAPLLTTVIDQPQWTALSDAKPDALFLASLRAALPSTLAADGQAIALGALSAVLDRAQTFLDQCDPTDALNAAIAGLGDEVAEILAPVRGLLEGTVTALRAGGGQLLSQILGDDWQSMIATAAASVAMISSDRLLQCLLPDLGAIPGAQALLDALSGGLSDLFGLLNALQGSLGPAALLLTGMLQFTADLTSILCSVLTAFRAFVALPVGSGVSNPADLLACIAGPPSLLPDLRLSLNCQLDVLVELNELLALVFSELQQLLIAFYGLPARFGVRVAENGLCSGATPITEIATNSWNSAYEYAQKLASTNNTEQAATLLSPLAKAFVNLPEAV